MIKKKLLVVDTNIISKALTPSQTACFADLFKELEKEYRFVVTGFTKYEAMRTSNKEKKKKISEYIAREMVRVDLSDELISFGSRVYYLYKNCDHVTPRISDGDVINAAFAIAKDCAVLTIDNSDYPRLFFAEKGRHTLTFVSSKGKVTHETAYVLHPDMSKLKECFEEHKV